jgi:hypothetical protein
MLILISQECSIKNTANSGIMSFHEQDTSLPFVGVRSPGAVSYRQRLHYQQQRVSTLPSARPLGNSSHYADSLKTSYATASSLFPNHPVPQPLLHPTFIRPKYTKTTMHALSLQPKNLPLNPEQNIYL